MSFPKPLDNSQWWNPGTWFLPASTLSFTSAFIYVFIILYVYLGYVYIGNEVIQKDLRFLFTLPVHELPNTLKYPVLVILASTALLLSLFIAFQTRNRPSRIFVKLWTLVVVIISISTLLLLLKSTPPESWDSDWWKWTSFQHTLLLACIMAVLTLLPRLLKPRVDSRTIQLITPITLICLIPLSMVIVLLGNGVEKQQQKHVESVINDLNNEHTLLRTILSKSTLTLSDRTNALNKLMTRPKVTHEILAIEEKMSLELMDKSASIVQSYTKLIAGIANLEYDLPSIYENGSSPFTYSKETDTWEVNQKTFNNNKDISNYYQALNSYIFKLKQELESTPLKNKEKLESQLSIGILELRRKLVNKLNNWVDFWLTYQVPVVLPDKKYTEANFIESLINIPIFGSASFSKIESVTHLDGGRDKRKNTIINNKSCFVEKENYLRCYAYTGNTQESIIALEYRVTHEKNTHHIDLVIPNVNSTLKLPPELVNNELLKTIKNQIKENDDLKPTKDSKRIGEIKYYGKDIQRINFRARKKYKGLINE